MPNSSVNTGQLLRLQKLGMDAAGLLTEEQKAGLLEQKTGLFEQEFNFLNDVLAKTTAAPSFGVAESNGRQYFEAYFKGEDFEGGLLRFTTNNTEGQNESFVALQKAHKKGFNSVMDLLKSSRCSFGKLHGTTSYSIVVLPESEARNAMDAGTNDAAWKEWQKSAGLKDALKDGNWS